MEWILILMVAFVSAPEKVEVEYTLTFAECEARAKRFMEKRQNENPSAYCLGRVTNTLWTAPKYKSKFLGGPDK